MGLSGKIFCLTKMSRRRGFSKKRRFCRFFVSPSKKISTGCHSDNFDPRTSAYGPYESLCPKFSKTPLRKSKIFKIEGVMPLQSQVIPICVPQKRCFFGTFLEKILFLTHFDQSKPSHDRHIRKAVHLSFLHVPQHKSFFEPAGRQNFANASGLT